MASRKTMATFDLEQNVFDPDETRILSAAFAKAWVYVEFDPRLGVLDVSERQSKLARCLMALLKLGEADPTSLANSAIRMLRERKNVRLRVERDGVA